MSGRAYVSEYGVCGLHPSRFGSGAVNCRRESHILCCDTETLHGHLIQRARALDVGVSLLD